MFNSKSQPPKLKIGLALGGGGARGLAHIGVLKVLEQAGIRPQLVVGTSMGSIIGALYCFLQDALLVENKILSRLKSPKMVQLGLDKFSRQKSKNRFDRNLRQALERLTRVYMLTTVVTKDHLIAEENIKVLLSLLVPEVEIENLPLPFAAVAADLLSGLPYIFHQGSAAVATRASAAIPGIFPPVPYQGMQLVDGCVVSLIPVLETLQLGANFVIAVDVSQPLAVTKPFRTGVDIWLRADFITNMRLRDVHLNTADMVIRVKNLNFSWNSFNSAREIIAAGARAAQDALPEILLALKAPQPLPWWKRWLSRAKK